MHLWLSQAEDKTQLIVFRRKNSARIVEISVFFFNFSADLELSWYRIVPSLRNFVVFLLFSAPPGSTLMGRRLHELFRKSVLWLWILATAYFFADSFDAFILLAATITLGKTILVIRVTYLFSMVEILSIIHQHRTLTPGQISGNN